MFVRFGFTPEFCQQPSAVFDQIFCKPGMFGRINSIKTMPKHSDSGQIIFNSGFVCNGIHTKSKSADDRYILCCQFFY